MESTNVHQTIQHSIPIFKLKYTYNQIQERRRCSIKIMTMYGKGNYANKDRWQSNKQNNSQLPFYSQTLCQGAADTSPIRCPWHAWRHQGLLLANILRWSHQGHRDRNRSWEAKATVQTTTSLHALANFAHPASLSISWPSVASIIKNSPWRNGNT